MHVESFGHFLLTIHVVCLMIYHRRGATRLPSNICQASHTPLDAESVRAQGHLLHEPMLNHIIIPCCFILYSTFLFKFGSYYATIALKIIILTFSHWSLQFNNTSLIVTIPFQECYNIAFSVIMTHN